MIKVTAFGQGDTVVVDDIRSNLVAFDDDGVLSPVFDAAKHQSVGFILTEQSTHSMRICNATPVSVWVDGQFLSKLESGCVVLNQEIFWADSNADTLFVSLFSLEGFNELRVELLAYGAVAENQESDKQRRQVRAHFREFTIIVLLFLLAFAGILIVRHPARATYILKRTLSLKSSSYELADTRFFTEGGILFSIFLSAIISFIIVYLSNGFFAGVEGEMKYLGDFVMIWLQIAALILGFIVAKWLLNAICAGLFGFRRVSEFQVFDFVNVTLLFLTFMTIVFAGDFVVTDGSLSWFGSGFSIVFVVVWSVFIIYFLLKFVSSQPHKKLLIISYLCATEILPVVLLAGWFFK